MPRSRSVLENLAPNTKLQHAYRQGPPRAEAAGADAGAWYGQTANSLRRARRIKSPPYGASAKVAC